MKAFFHKNFEKKYRRADAKLQKHIDNKILLFLKYPFHPQLNNHALKGTYSDYRSINITGDYRALYKMLDKESVEFIDVDTHGNLYL